MSHFLSKNQRPIFFKKKIIWANFKSLRCCNFMQKKTKNKNKKNKSSKHYFFKKLQKPHLEPILGPFLSKSFKTKLCPKTPFISILIPYATVTLQTKWEKFHAMTFDNTCKTSFLSPFNPKTSRQIVPN